MVLKSIFTACLVFHKKLVFRSKPCFHGKPWPRVAGVDSAAPADEYADDSHSTASASCHQRWDRANSNDAGG